MSDFKRLVDSIDDPDLMREVEQEITQELARITDRDELVERDLRFFSSSALLELTPSQLEEWAGASRRAIARIQADAATIARMREALVQAREAMSDGDPYKDVARQMVDAALKGGDHG